MKLIVQKFLLQSNVDFIHQFFYQSKFKPISKRQFVSSEVMRIWIYVMLFQSTLRYKLHVLQVICSELDFHIYYLFVLGS
jgi:hypothetical protein